MCLYTKYILNKKYMYTRKIKEMYQNARMKDCDTYQLSVENVSSAEKKKQETGESGWPKS